MTCTECDFTTVYLAFRKVCIKVKAWLTFANIKKAKRKTLSLRTGNTNVGRSTFYAANHAFDCSWVWI